MTAEEHIKVVGIIQSIGRDKWGSTELCVLDEEKRLIVAHYEYLNPEIYIALSSGMKVQVIIKGPLLDTRTTYEGVGIIRLLENPRERKRE